VECRAKYEHLFPAEVKAEQGKKYFWCGCGKSPTQPLCDTVESFGDNALLYIADLTEDVCFCNCKQTKNPPFCDGSHAKVLTEVVKNRKKNETKRTS